MRLYRAEAWDKVTATGVTVHIEEATAVDVDGRLYADRWQGEILTAASRGWHETRAAAMASVIETIEGYIAILAAQADRLKQEAANG